MITIIGCPRSGTMFISKLFQEHGIDVGHEKMGKDGIAWWYLAVHRNLKGRIVHQVRHPLAVIGSMTTLLPASWDYIGVHVGFSRNESLIQMAMRTWLYWNDMAHHIAHYHYLVEDALHGQFDKLCDLAGWDAKLKSPVLTPTTINSRPHPELSWSDLDREKPSLAIAIRSMAQTYGYEV